MVLPGTLFEELGFNYIGPMDGHDVRALVSTLRNVQEARAARSSCTWSPARARATRPRRPIRSSGTGRALSIRRAAPSSRRRRPGLPTRRSSASGCATSRSAIRSIIGITPAMREGSGLVEFSKRFPDRYFDVAIAEQHAVTFAAGLATEGLKPVVAIYSTFLQRGYDQLIHDVALQNLPVLFAVDRAGLVGSDGATHQGSYDLSYLRCIPNLVIMAPATRTNAGRCSTPAPPSPARASCAIRAAPAPAWRSRSRSPPCRSAARSCGARAAAASRCSPSAPWSSRPPRIAERLDATLVNMRFVKPLDEALILDLAAPPPRLHHPRGERRAGRRRLRGRPSCSPPRASPCRCCRSGSPTASSSTARATPASPPPGSTPRASRATVERWWSLQPHDRIRSVGSA